MITQRGIRHQGPAYPATAHLSWALTTLLAVQREVPGVSPTPRGTQNGIICTPQDELRILLAAARIGARRDFESHLAHALFTFGGGWGPQRSGPSGRSAMT
jgi:hypothetical protein